MPPLGTAQLAAYSVHDLRRARFSFSKLCTSCHIEHLYAGELVAAVLELSAPAKWNILRDTPVGAGAGAETASIPLFSLGDELHWAVVVSAAVDNTFVEAAAFVEASAREIVKLIASVSIW